MVGLYRPMCAICLSADYRASVYGIGNRQIGHSRIPIPVRRSAVPSALSSPVLRPRSLPFTFRTYKSPRQSSCALCGARSQRTEGVGDRRRQSALEARAAPRPWSRGASVSCKASSGSRSACSKLARIVARTPLHTRVASLPVARKGLVPGRCVPALPG